jgi:hypothetical protein
VNIPQRLPRAILYVGKNDKVDVLSGEVPNHTTDPSVDTFLFRTGVHAYGTDHDENATGADFDSADCGQPLSAVFRIHASIFTSGSYLSALYHRLAARRGKKRAIIAVAHSLGISVYHMLARRQPYQELGADYFDQRSKGVKTDWLLKQLNKLGYHAHLEPILAA